jgi:hypothetical protein
LENVGRITRSGVLIGAQQHIRRPIPVRKWNTKSAENLLGYGEAKNGKKSVGNREEKRRVARQGLARKWIR